MGKSAKAPLPPDYSGIANAASASAAMSADVARDQLAWAKQTYAADREVSDKVINYAMERAQKADAQADEDRAFYTKTYRPLEKQLAKEATEYDSETKQEEMAGRAQADVAQQFDQARKAAADRLESFGLDPSQTRSAALDVSTRTQQAAASAAAGNQGREQAKATGRALRSEAINVGRGYPGQINQSYNTAMQSGNQAVNAGLATTGSGSNTMGTGLQWNNAQNQSLGAWGNAMNTGYGNSMAAVKFNNDRSSGIGTLAGLGVGLAGKYMTAGLFDEGGEVPPSSPGHQGMAVPVGVSPSNGENPDDVPARLSAGEFIIPDDVTRWKGEEFFQKLIEKSRVDKDGAPAKPQQTALPPERPVVATALPVR